MSHSSTPLSLEDTRDTGSCPYASIGVDHVSIAVPREEVEAGDLSTTLSMLAPLVHSRSTAQNFRERVAIYFDGYNETRDELFEIVEVRNFVQALDARFPYWLYFLDKSAPSFDVIWRCYMPPFLTREAKAREFPERLHELLTKWWIPAMNDVCNFVGMSDDEADALLDRSVLYMQGHRSF